MDAIEELLTRGVENIIPNKEKLRALLIGGRKLNIYLGIDPTATNIHIGHAVALRKLQAFAKLGHNVTFLIGDFTALIGDTSDKESERPILTSEQIEKNFQTYKEQAQKILDFSKVKVRHNSEWLKKLTFEEIIKLTYHFSAGDFYSRELIKKRLNEGLHVGLHEILYPVMQGYDSYFMDTDIQLGGTDQTFNMQAGRVLQKDLRKKESFIIANGFLEGTDGRKMSKTWNNAIWLNDPPKEMYGKIMSLKDDLIIQYFSLATNTPLEKIEEIKRALSGGDNPMKWKKQLAYNIVKELYTLPIADEAQKQFELQFQKKDFQQATLPLVPITSLNSTASVSQILIDTNIASSKSQAKRLISQGSVSFDDYKATSDELLITLKPGTIIGVGKIHIKLS
ncbi:MAG: tyrosine--tRNA ligase [Patescibacteria group bacterium]